MGMEFAPVVRVMLKFLGGIEMIEAPIGLHLGNPVVQQD
jgi:hypothetical protein